MTNIALLLLAALAALAPGSSLPPLTLSDQHDVATTIGAQTRVIIFTRDMDAGDLVKETLATQPALLDAAQAVYVSDISGMPSLIARMFALPAMRKRPYRILLDRDGKATAELPSVAGKVTVIALDQGRITAISFVDSSAALTAALSPP